jgi:hypothetical protein
LPSKAKDLLSQNGDDSSLCFRTIYSFIRLKYHFVGDPPYRIAFAPNSIDNVGALQAAASTHNSGRAPPREIQYYTYICIGYGK